MGRSFLQRHSKKEILALGARSALALGFLVHAFVKMAHFDSAVALLVSKGIPLAGFVCALSTAVEAAAAAMLIVGFATRAAAAALALVLTPATILFNLAEAQRQAILLKDVAILGGLAQIFIHGPGALSFDESEE